jgi:hypothetical protein
LRKGRFVYRTLSKTFAFHSRSALQNHQHSFLSPHTAVINTTLAYNWESRLHQKVEARSLLDVKTLKITPLKASQFKDMHVIFSCGYFIALKMDDKGPVSGQLFIYETDPNDLTNISNEPISVLEFPRDQTSIIDAHILCNRLLMHSNYQTDMFTGRTTMKVYDFKQSVADPIAEFSFYGHAMGMNENYIVIAVKRVSSHDVNVLDWRKSSGSVPPQEMIKFSHYGPICAAAVSGDRLLCWESPRSLHVWDLKTKQLISTFVVSALPAVQDSRIACFQGNFCFLIAEECCAVFDLVSGSIVCSISVGEIMNIEPILNEEGRPSGRYYITGKYHRGILDLLGPKLGHKFEVLQLPAANSVKAATDKIQRIEVVNRDLSATLAKICGKIDDGAIESQVLLMKKNKYRYTLIFNCKLHGTAQEMPSRLVTKLLGASKLPPHFENCPVHCVNFDGKADKFNQRLDNDQVPIFQYLRGFGPSILMYEEWSESHGWVPTSIPSSFDLKKFKKKLK